LSSVLKNSLVENVGLAAVEVLSVVLVAVALLLFSSLEKYIGKS
jgi:hypothetical protein